MVKKNCFRGLIISFYPVPAGNTQWRIQSWSQFFFSKSRKFKLLMKVGASNSVTRLITKIMTGGGGVPGNQKTPLDTPLIPVYAHVKRRITTLYQKIFSTLPVCTRYII